MIIVTAVTGEAAMIIAPAAACTRDSHQSATTIAATTAAIQLQHLCRILDSSFVRSSSQTAVQATTAAATAAVAVFTAATTATAPRRTATGLT